MTDPHNQSRNTETASDNEESYQCRDSQRSYLNAYFWPGQSFVSKSYHALSQLHIQFSTAGSVCASDHLEHLHGHFLLQSSFASNGFFGSGPNPSLVVQGYENTGFSHICVYRQPIATSAADAALLAASLTSHWVEAGHRGFLSRPLAGLMVLKVPPASWFAESMERARAVPLNPPCMPGFVLPWMPKRSSCPPL